MSRINTGLLPALVLSLLVGACVDETGPVGVEPNLAVAEDVSASTLNLTGLVTVDVAGASLEFWPYTGRTPTLGDAADPINLIMRGSADPRLLRARLMMLDGDRSAFGFPNVDPFNCTWTDAIGGTQATVATGYGWAGSSIQLQCGAYDPTRFHLRFFQFGDWTVANSHFDLLIPGTTDHEVLSWELAEQIALVDFLRIGGVPGATGIINEAPTYRQIRPAVFGLLPAPLKGLLLATNSITSDGSLVNNGSASTLVLPALPTDQDGAVLSRQELEVAFDQVIPRPFCQGGGTDYLYVTGPVTLTQKLVYSPSGNLASHYHAKGSLDVVQVNPLTGDPLSEPYRAHVNQHGRSIVNAGVNMVNDIQLQMEIREGGKERGQLKLNMRIGPNGASAVSGSASCKA